VKKTENHIYLKIVIICAILFIACLEIAYVMRDKNEFWCNLSSGSYKKISGCGLQPDSRCRTPENKVCTGGLFDVGGNRNVVADSKMKATTK
jgi:hypothetical protein